MLAGNPNGDLQSLIARPVSQLCLRAKYVDNRNANLCTQPTELLNPRCASVDKIIEITTCCCHRKVKINQTTCWRSPSQSSRLPHVREEDSAAATAPSLPLRARIMNSISCRRGNMYVSPSHADKNCRAQAFTPNWPKMSYAPDPQKVRGRIRQKLTAPFHSPFVKHLGKL
ncbi:unnamed protein product [Peronospora farinosa]|nr:unnamed protein product [Peronospora farinosa]CAI5722988.1 unnamed protein product [Peronospora farinosa]